MGGKSDPPPPPNYQPLADASLAASAQSAQIAQQQLAWAQKAQRRTARQQQPLIDAQIAALGEATRNAAADRAFWEQNYQPVEQALAKDALTWDQPAHKEMLAGQAGAEIATQYEGARRSAIDELQSHGVDPSQITTGALDLGMRVSKAAATAQAINTSRATTDQQAIAMRQAAAATGRGLQSAAITEQGQGVQTAATAAQTGLAGTTAFLPSLGNALGWQQQSAASLGQGFDIMHGGYSDALAYTKQLNEASSGFGQLAGTALGVIGGKALSKYATGGSVGADHAPPAGQMNLGPQGGAIPTDIGGPPTPQTGTDTVQAMVTPGEYIIPKDAATRKGSDYWDKQVFNARIQSAQQRMQHQQAIPTIAHPQQAQPQPMPGGANIPPQALPMVA